VQKTGKRSCGPAARISEDMSQGDRLAYQFRGFKTPDQEIPEQPMLLCLKACAAKHKCDKRRIFSVSFFVTSRDFPHCGINHAKAW
jgi:hypothetical protein